jgi:hypothetical protein
MGIVWRREGFGTGAIYYWKLPDASKNGLNGFHTGPLAQNDLAF